MSDISIVQNASAVKVRSCKESGSRGKTAKYKTFSVMSLAFSAGAGAASLTGGFILPLIADVISSPILAKVVGEALCIVAFAAGAYLGYTTGKGKFAGR